MKIVVLVKQVPDSGSERSLRSDDSTVDRGSANNVINEMDEYAIEAALKLKEAHGGEVTILTMGPQSAAESIRKALSMGPDKAVHILDDALHGSCALATSKVIAAAVKALEPDLVGWRATLPHAVFVPDVAQRIEVSAGRAVVRDSVGDRAHRVLANAKVNVAPEAGLPVEAASVFDRGLGRAA